MRHFALMPLVALAACAQAPATVKWLANQHGLDARVTADPLGNDRWRMRVETSTVALTENAAALFEQTAQRHCRNAGKPTVIVETLAQGVENSLTGGRRFADGVVQCRGAAP